MARKKKTEVEQDPSAPMEETASDAGPAEIIDTRTALVDEVPVRGSVVSAPTEPLPEPKKVTRFRVLNGGRIMYRGQMAWLKQGKIVTEQGYDLGILRQQGIKLEALEE